MEGYLLVFTKERAAQVWYCVLETGLIKCYDSHAGGATLIDCIELTRHRVRVKPLIGGNVCPNRFVLHATEVKRNDQVGKLAAVALREKTHVFATATSDKMCKWINAIHNWRRHTFDDPLGMFADNDGDPAVEPSSQQSRRRAELELDRLNVIGLASRFDIRLSRCKPVSNSKSSNNKTRFPRISPISSIGEAAARKVLLLRPSRASGVIASWLPTFSSSSHEKRNTIS
ncbi:hypothetical protein Gpo141_00011418 [Globisporangium polare]